MFDRINCVVFHVYVYMFMYIYVSITTHCFGISNANSQGYSQRHSTASYDHRPALRNFARRYNYLVDLFPRTVFAQSRLEITEINAIYFTRLKETRFAKQINKKVFNLIVGRSASKASLSSVRSRRNKQLREIIRWNRRSRV